MSILVSFSVDVEAAMLPDGVGVGSILGVTDAVGFIVCVLGGVVLFATHSQKDMLVTVVCFVNFLLHMACEMKFTKMFVAVLERWT